MARRVKGKSAFTINSHLGCYSKVWQKGFHDHAIRKDEDIKAVARYIIANPLRAGLVENIGDYPFWDAVWLQRCLSQFAAEAAPAIEWRGTSNEGEDRLIPHGKGGGE